MPVRVAEYLGQRVDIDVPAITPIPSGNNADCPFMEDLCWKLNRRRPYHPICSVRKTDGELWITCPDRLSSTKKKRLTDYQRGQLLSVARAIWGNNVDPNRLLFSREKTVPQSGGESYHADYVAVNQGLKVNPNAPSRVIMEMQGGGETSGTGGLTRLVDRWAAMGNPTNAILREYVEGVGTLETNAWRRQQEQFLVKGSTATQTGGGIVFCVGSTLYDHILRMVSATPFSSLRQHAWNLALIGIKEDRSAIPSTGPAPVLLGVDPNRQLFTNFMTFVQVLVNRGVPHPPLFEGEFDVLAGGTQVI